MKIFSNDPRTRGVSVTLPIIGKVTFNSITNCIEVQDDLVDVLLSLKFGMDLSVANAGSAQISNMKSKLDSIEIGATKNLRDVDLLNRENHIGDTISETRTTEDIVIVNDTKGIVLQTQYGEPVRVRVQSVDDEPTLIVEKIYS